MLEVMERDAKEALLKLEKEDIIDVMFELAINHNMEYAKQIEGQKQEAMIKMGLYMVVRMVRDKQNT